MRRWARWSLGLLLAACSGPPPLPPVEPAPTIAAVGDPAVGARLFADRAFSRSGFACADCHPGPATGLRPAPDLSRWAAGEGRWAGQPRDPAETLAACVERFGARSAPSPAEAGHLRAAIGAMQPAPAAQPAQLAQPDDAEALYRAACLHCHEAGPAGPVTGRRWLSGAVRAALRAPRGLDRLMPRFDPSRLPDRAVDGLVAWLVGIAAESDTLSP